MSDFVDPIPMWLVIKVGFFGFVGIVALMLSTLLLWQIITCLMRIQEKIDQHFWRKF